MNGVCGEKVLSAVANKSHAAPDPFVGGEEDPGPGLLRRFMGQRWPLFLRGLFAAPAGRLA